MGKINDIVGAIGGTIMVLELIILIVVFIAIDVALLIGLRWVRGKETWVREKRQFGQSLVTRYVDRGAGIAAAPVIVCTSAWRGFKAGLHRATHWQAVAELPPHAAQELTTGSRSPKVGALNGPHQAP